MDHYSKLVIAPSFLSCNFLQLEQEIEALNKIPNLWYHIDVMDGHFVKNFTFGHPTIKQLASISAHPVDVHLMVNNPDFHFEKLKNCRIHNITFHLEAAPDNHLPYLISLGKKYFPSIGISIKPSTPVEKIPLNLLQLVNLILVMTVEPGEGGQSFMAEMIPKIKSLKDLAAAHNPELIIEVDGGINEITSKSVRRAGATHLVAGSYIFSKDRSEYLQQINNLII